MGNRLGEKIIVIGSPGSGKSRLSLKLRDLTGLPLYHLDNVWWKPDRTHVTREEFDAKLAEILQKDRFIIDGSYSRTFEPRFAACDTVVWLDLPVDECLRGVSERLGSVRPDIPWSEKELDPELVALVETYNERNCPALKALFEKYKDKKQIILKSREETNAWLASLEEDAKY